VTSASGTAGSTSIAYHGDGLATSVDDAAGTTSYGYDNDDRLSSVSDPLSGTTLGYSYNSMSQLSRVQYGTGDVEALGYNGLHELTSDSLDTASGSSVASLAYGYDADGDLTSMNTTGLAGASANSYTYDDAGRLTSWNNGSATTSYGYDADGNMTQDGSKAYSYDARDELTSDGSNTYSYTANGTQASETSSGGTVTTSAFDAYGDQVKSGTQSYTYDALGRLTADTGGGDSWAFSYDGMSSALASDGVSDYTWDPSGTSLVGIGSAGGGGAGSGVLAMENQHGNVVGNFTQNGTSLSGSQGYDPWGDVTGTTGTVEGQLGYQSGWTDPATQKVQMGSRWYTPATGDFTSKDTASNAPTPSSGSANPFAYVADNPVGATDPSGHYLIDDSADGTYVRPSPPPPPSCGGWFSCGWSSVVNHVSSVVHRVVHAVRKVVKKVVHVVKKVVHEVKKAATREVRNLNQVVADASAWGAAAVATAYDEVGSATSRAYHSVTNYAKKAVKEAVHVVSTAYHAAKRVATATVHFVQHHAAAIAAIAVTVVVMAGCEATLGTVTAEAATPVCSAIAGAAGNAASYAVTAAETHKFSWSALGKTSAEGAAAGLVGDEFGGVATDLLSSGADAAASALSSTASDEVTDSAVDESAGETASEAGQDAEAEEQTAGDDDATEDDPSCPTEGGESFSASTRVLLANGKSVAISGLKVGDKVKAVDTKTGKTQVKTVEAVLVHHDTDLYDLTVKSGGKTEVIDTTITCSGTRRPISGCRRASSRAASTC
jgi:RHS repeat-associated protein